MFRKPRAPLADGVRCGVHPARNVFVLQPFRRKQNDPSPLSQSLRRSTPRRKPLEFAPLAPRDRNRRLAHPEASANLSGQNRTYLPIRTLVYPWFSSGIISPVSAIAEQGVYENNGAFA